MVRPPCSLCTAAGKRNPIEAEGFFKSASGSGLGFGIRGLPTSDTIPSIENISAKPASHWLTRGSSAKNGRHAPRLLPLLYLVKSTIGTIHGSRCHVDSIESLALVVPNAGNEESRSVSGVKILSIVQSTYLVLGIV